MFTELLTWIFLNILSDNPKNISAQKIRDAFTKLLANIEDVVTSAGTGLYPGSIEPTSAFPSAPNANIFLVTTAGSYTNFKNVNNNPVVLNANNFGFIIKTDNGCVIKQIAIPQPDLTSINNAINQIENSNTQFRADINYEISDLKQEQEHFIENFSVEVDQILNKDSENAISNKAVTNVLPTKTSKKLVYDSFTFTNRYRLQLNGTAAYNVNSPKEYTSDFLELKKGQTISFRAHVVSSTLAIAIYSTNTEASFKSGITGLSVSGTTTASELSEYSYTAQEDVYVRLGLYDSTATNQILGNAYKKEVFITKTISQQISELIDEKILKDNVNSLGSYNDYTVTTREVKYAGNLGSDGSFAIGKPPVLAVGTTANRGWISDWIEVKKGDKIIFHSMVRSNENAISFYTDKRIENYVIGSIGVGGSNPTTKSKYELIVPDDGLVLAYCYFTNGNSSLVPPIVQIHRATISIGNIDNILTKENNLVKNTNRNVSMDRLRFKKPTNGAISIIDDDGHEDVYDLLYPYLRDRGFPLGIAIVGSWHDRISRQNYANQFRMTESELLEIAEDKNIIEILNHTYTHTHAVGTEEHVRFELETNHKWLTDRGLHPKAFVAPQGQYDINTIKVSSEMYPCLYTVLNGINTNDNMRNFELKRVDYGASNSEHKTFEKIKPYIDQAIATNSWMILMTHVGGYNDGPTWWPVFEQICDYIESTAITPMFPSDAFKAYGNFTEVYQVNKMGSDYQVRSY